MLKAEKECRADYACSKSELATSNSKSEFGGGASEKKNNKTIDKIGQQKLMHNWAKSELTELADIWHQKSFGVKKQSTGQQHTKY